MYRICVKDTLSNIYVGIRGAQKAQNPTSVLSCSGVDGYGDSDADAFEILGII
jgi:hypothetical protein